MSKSGENNFKGINSQALAAMSLFLQFLRDSRFSHIKLEGDKLEDFTLYFEDGHKIICEAKDRQEKFSYPHLKQVLQNVIANGGLRKDDEILIVCTNLNESFQSEVKHAKYYEPLKVKFAKKAYSEDQFKLLPRVKFWVVPPSFNQGIVFSLFTELMNFWIPPEEVEKVVNNILIQKIYRGSAEGGTYSRVEILKEVEDFKVEIQKAAEYFNEQVRAKEDQFNSLEKIVSKGGKLPSLGSRSLSTFSARWDLMSFAMDRLKSRKDLDLRNWDDIWKMNRVYFFTFGIFDVFKNNLESQKNRMYIIEYIKKHTRSPRGFYRSDYFPIDVVRILRSILEQEGGKQYLNDSFAVVQDLLTYDSDEYFYLKGASISRDEWQRGEITKLLLEIYNSADKLLKARIATFVLSNFNITEDDGEFDWYTPKEVYSILFQWLEEDFVKRFSKLVQHISNQYNVYYQKFGKKLKFTGWELMGGGTSFMNGNYHVGDRHFVWSILQPAIKNFYDANPRKAWKFIKGHCISKAKEVSKERPDFLNRSVYQIVLDRYADKDEAISHEAFLILKEFVLSRGIPHKYDLIYQSIVSSSLDTEKKWRLVSLTIKKYEIPVNSFVENIVLDQVKNGNIEAKNVLKGWYGNPKYYGRFMSDHDSVSNIKKMLDIDFEFGVQLFFKLIASEYIKADRDKGRHFGSYDIAGLLYDIISRNYDSGLSVLRWLEKERKLSVNQQIVYTFSLFNHHGNDGSDDKNLLLRIYSDVVDPFLKAHSTSPAIVARISHGNSREAFVQLACRLAANREIEKALRIIKVFIDDPDPYLPHRDPEDKKDEFNEHKNIEDGKEPQSIRSVRGWCGWALMKCSILDGRDYLPEIITLTKKLVSDPNYYTVHMGCFALAQIAKNRLTVMPSDRSTLFFNDDRVIALQRSKKVEKVALDLLERMLTWPSSAQDAMAKSVLHVFDSIRSLNEKDSLALVNNLARLPRETLQESAPLFIYFAEYRKDAYKDWKFSEKGLYDDLQPEKYDDTKFKQILIDTIGKCQKEDPDSCFKFAASIEHIMRDAVEKGDTKDESTELALRYFDIFTNTYAHNIFNLMYHMIEQKLQHPDNYLDQWFALLMKCLRIEKDFYYDQEKKDNLSQVYWYPTLYHSRILELVHERMGNDRFMQAADIFFAFPEKMELHESEQLVSIVETLSKTNRRAGEVIEMLRLRNPSKYWSRGKRKKS